MHPKVKLVHPRPELPCFVTGTILHDGVHGADDSKNLLVFADKQVSEQCICNVMHSSQLYLSSTNNINSSLITLICVKIFSLYLDFQVERSACGTCIVARLALQYLHKDIKLGQQKAFHNAVVPHSTLMYVYVYI